MKRNLLFAAACALLFLPLSAGAAGRELTPRVIAPYSVDHSAIASNGDGFLAVWTPYKPFRVDVMPFDAGGKPGRTSALSLQDTDGLRAEDVAAFEGGYVIAANSVSADRRLILLFVDAAGNLVRKVPTTLDSVADVRIATSDDTILIAGNVTAATGNSLYLFFLDQNGTERSTAQRLPQSNSTPFAMTSAGDGFALAAGDPAMQVRRFDASGNPIGDPVSIPGHFSTIDLAFQSDTLVVAGSDTTGHVYAATVQPGLKVTLVDRNFSDSDVNAIRIGFADGSFRITFDRVDARGVTHQLKTASFLNEKAGAVFDIGQSLDNSGLADAATNGHVIVAMREQPLFAAATTWTASRPLTSDTTPVSTHAADQSLPAMSTDGRTFFAAWLEAQQMKAIRIDANGSPIKSPVVVDDAPATPAIAFGSNEYLLVRQRPDTLLGTRFNPDGTPIDQQPVVIRKSNAFTARPAVAWNGRNFVVAWGESKRIYAAIVTPAGAVAGAPHTVSPDPAVSGHAYASPRVASDSSEHTIVAFSTKLSSGTANGYPIDVVQLDASAVLMGSPHRVPASSEWINTFDIAHGSGSEFMMLVTDDRGVVSIPVHGGGTVTFDAPQRIFDWSRFALIPALTSNKTGYVASWSYAVSGTPPDSTLASVTSAYVAYANLDIHGSKRDLFVNRSDRESIEVDDDPIKVAVNSNGDRNILVEQLRQDGSVRLLLYRPEDFDTAPLPPAPLIIRIRDGGDDLKTVSWNGGEGTIDGFTIGATLPDGSESVLYAVAADVRSVTIPNPKGTVVVRAFNAGGFSAQSTVATGGSSRRRAVVP